MRFSLNLLVSFVVVATGVAFGQEQGPAAGQLTGYVYNASRITNKGTDIETEIERTAIAGQEVILQRNINGKPDNSIPSRTVTDSNGRFEFTALETGAEFGYYPRMIFNELEHYGPVVTLTEEVWQKRSDIPAFESTRSDSNVSAAMHHIILTPAGGLLNVKEVIYFTNRGKRTYLGKAPIGQKKTNIVLHIEVPPEAKDLRFGGELMSCCAVVIDNQIYDTMALKPGPRQETITYQLPYDGDHATLSKKLTHPTAMLDVYLPEERGALTSPGFTAEGGFNINGQNFQRYTSAELEKEHTLTVHVAGLPAAAPDLRWLAPIILLVMILASVAVYRWRSKLKPSASSQTRDNASAAPQNSKREFLLRNILALDDQFNQGEIDEKTYLARRDHFESRILALSYPDEGPKLNDLKPNQEAK